MITRNRYTILTLHQARVLGFNESSEAKINNPRVKKPKLFVR
jgi:hypothetical protein